MTNNLQDLQDMSSNFKEFANRECMGGSAGFTNELARLGFGNGEPLIEIVCYDGVISNTTKYCARYFGNCVTCGRKADTISDTITDKMCPLCLKKNEKQ